MPNYQYFPVFGVEPYEANSVPVSDNFGGGADVTNNNLMITLWSLPGYGGSGNPTTGQLLKPFVNTADGAAAITSAAAGGVGIAHGYDQTLKSRYSSRFFLIDVNLGSQEQPNWMLPTFMLALLQMPQDMRNDLLSFVKRPVSASPVNIDFLRSFFYSQTWDFSAASPVFQVFQEAAFFGGFYNTGGGTSALCKTSGADGTFPVFYEQSTDGSIEMVQDLINGEDVFVPCIFTRGETLDSVNPEMFSISYPGSNARR